MPGETNGHVSHRVPKDRHPTPEKRMDNAAMLYLDLLKRCLTNWLYGNVEEAKVRFEGLMSPEAALFCRSQGIRLLQRRSYEPRLRSEGRDWPPTAHTMIGPRRLDNLQFCIEDVLAHHIPGDLIETGVWRGGATIFMRAVLKCPVLAAPVCEPALLILCQVRRTLTG